MLEVDTKGFRQLQAGRPKWSFVRELISNAFDENITTCRVTVLKNGRDPAIITVEDDGAGFRDLKDAYTLFAPTPKRSDPNVRGRFNLGEKELASIAKEMKIESTTGGIHFKDGKRKRINKKRDRGTKVTVTVNWSQSDINEIDQMIRTIIVPNGITLYYGGTINCNPYLIDSTEAKLRTTLFSDGAMRPTTRITKVDVYELHYWQEKGWIYELGIPIQQIECPYNVDVNQKVPMNTNRDTVSDYYLKDIYALVLNMTVEDLTEEDVSETWVRQATEDELTTDETISNISEKRYKDAVLWSSDSAANEKAIAAGKEIIHGRTLSSIERDRFKSSGLVSSSVNFGSFGIPADSIPPHQWTDGMKKLAELTKWLSMELQNKKVHVRFINEFKISHVASYGGNEVTFNIGRFGRKNTEPPYSGYVIGTIIHELAHRKGHGHFDMKFINELSNLAGAVSLLASNDPKTFKKKIGE